MIKSSYEPASLLRRSQLWRAEAEAATFPAMRAYCLSEAARCERMVQRSIEVPVIREHDEPAHRPDVKERVSTEYLATT